MHQQGGIINTLPTPDNRQFATASGLLPLRTPKLIVFDLDGTLVDSAADLVHAVNATLTDLGRPPRSDAEIASFIGDGARTLVARALCASGGIPAEHELDRALDFFLAHYREHLLDHTRPYPGVLDALHALRAAAPALLMTVLTNKPVNPSRRICDGLGLAPFFFANYGGNSFATKKPDPEGLHTLQREAETLLGTPLALDETVLVGDSDVDVRTARNAGVRSLGCTWGFATEKLLAAAPDSLAHHPSDWPSLLGLTSG